MNYETVIGLEVHVELATQSKIFCGCSSKFGAGENENVCPACCGMPGMLPVTNRKVVELGITAGLLTNCRINRVTTFDKKSYYYPDLPCSYQITQWFSPVCVDGHVEIETPQGKKSIGIKQIHMEEDAGKLVHDDWTDSSLVDFNRTSVPLTEIVSRPDFRSAQEVEAYLNRLRDILRFARVSDCRMEEGSMRCDVNISIRPEGSTELGVRTEIKNMNSVSAILRAIDYEVARHIDAIERHTEPLIQETRRWDDVKGQSYSMRSKETAADYRYFPDPNLVPIVIDQEWIDRVRESLPELPEVKRARYVSELGLSESESAILTASRSLCDLFEAAVAQGCAAKDAAGWIISELLGLLKKDRLTGDDLNMDEAKFAALVKLASSGKITRVGARRALAALYAGGEEPEEFCRKNNLFAVSDEGALRAVVQKAVDENPKMVAEYRAGKKKAIEGVFGKIMKELRGSGDPAALRKLMFEIVDGEQ